MKTFLLVSCNVEDCRCTMVDVGYMMDYMDDAWMHRWMHAWMHRWMYGCIDGCMGGCMDVMHDGWMHEIAGTPISSNEKKQ